MEGERRVLVTGGAGYIGSHVCKALARAGLVPVTYDNLSRGHRWAAKWGPLEVGDIRDRPRMREVLARHRPEAVLHLAALSEVGESAHQIELYRENNVRGSQVLLEAMREARIHRIVFSSSAAVYGIPLSDTITEDHPLRPINPYGETKVRVEKMLVEGNVKWGLGSISLRYFNAAGADLEGEVGESHDPETHLIPLALRAAMGEGDPLRVFGGDYETPDGTCVRDFVHVDDLAMAHLQALSTLERGPASERMNLGSEAGASVLEVIASVERVTGSAVPFKVEGRRAGDPPRLVASTAMARKVLGWTPLASALDDIVRSAWDWEGLKIRN